MAAEQTIKLLKLASETGRILEDIVEFLHSKGYDVPNKPTTAIPEEMAELVREKFKKDISSRQKVREKLEKNNILRNVAGAEPQPTQPIEVEIPSHNKSVQQPTPAVVDKVPIRPIELELPKKQEPVSHIPEVKAETKPEPIIHKETAAPEIKPEEVKKKEEEPSIQQIVEEIKPPVAESIKEKPTEPKKSKQKEHNEKLPKSEVLTEKEDNQPEVNLEKEKSEIISVEENISAEVKEEAKPKEKKITTPKETEDEHQKHKEKPIIEPKFEKPAANAIEKEKSEPQIEKIKKKRQKVIEVAAGEAPKLRGLTIVGKIDLEKEKQERESKQELQENRNKPSERRVFRERDTRNRSTQSQDDSTRPKPRTTDRKPFEAKSSPRAPLQITLASQQVAKDQDVIYRRKDKTKKPLFTDETEIVAKAPLKLKVKDKSKIKEEKFVKKHKKSIREQISEEDVQRAVKETFADLETMQMQTTKARIRQKKRTEKEEKEFTRQQKEQERANVMEITEFATTADLARMMDLNPNQIILKCMQMDLMVTINQRLDKDTIMLIAEDFGFKVEFQEAINENEIEIVDNEDDLLPRAPIVTIMGHVDHGKTTLLDFIRQSNIVAGEAGGITQHIGAYQVELDNGRQITFLDTPGHAAFTAMRARGAQVTDIVVLVVAADDSVMPQTIEAISHARAAGVPIIVAINKVDKPDANPDRIRQQLANQGVLVEEWGGKVQSIEISAKFGQNVDLLLEKILVEADLLDLKANPHRQAVGTIIEAVMKKGFGPVATVIILNGTLNISDPFVSGNSYGKVRAILDEREKRVESAGPSDPVLVVGFNTLPQAGDNFRAVENEIEARNIATERARLKREQELRQVRSISLDQISQRIQEGKVKDLNLILKADVSGSAEALSDSILKLSNDEVRVNILHKGVGTISETDVMLAAASEAVIIGFNVSTDPNARKIAENEKVDIRNYNIIYDCLNEIQLALEGLLTPEYQEETTGIAEVRQLFKISKIGTIAGCYMQMGKILKSDKIRVLRDGLIIFSGHISSLKRGKDDAREIDAGFECGIQISGFNDLQIGDTIESYKINEIKRKLN